MRSESHSFAPRIRSGLDGGCRPTGRPLRPAIECAAARNQASYSRLAKTRPILWSGRAVRARRRRSGPSSAGQPSSQSSKMKMAPPGPILRAPSSTARSNSPSLRRRPAGTRMGCGMEGKRGGFSSRPIRRTSSGTALTSPSPSTMQKTLETVIAASSRRGRSASTPAGKPGRDPGSTGWPAATHPRCTAGPRWPSG